MNEPLQARTLGFKASPFPVWVSINDPVKILWANAAALEIWDAPDLRSLIDRDLSDTTEATKIQLDAWIAEMAAGRRSHVSLRWTLHPRGVPTHLHMFISLFGDDEERRPMLLNQALPEALTVDREQVRGGEALRHISAAVVLLRADGTVLSRNPAAIRFFGATTPLDAWFADASVARTVLDVAKSGEVYIDQVAGGMTAPERVFSLEARPSRDPIEGEQVILLHLLDETARVGAEREALELELRATDLARALATVEKQKASILELSAPILPTADGVLAVPLIGHLDPPRMSHLSERLLRAVGAHKAHHVVLDFTGAKIEPNTGIPAIARLVRATRLLGAKVVITGVQAQLARDVVESTLDDWVSELFGDRTSVSASLAEGIKACQRRR